MTKRSKTSSSIGLAPTPLSSSALSLTALSACSTWWDCSRGAKPLSSLLSERNYFLFRNKHNVRRNQLRKQGWVSSLCTNHRRLRDILHGVVPEHFCRERTRGLQGPCLNLLLDHGYAVKEQVGLENERGYDIQLSDGAFSCSVKNRPQKLILIDEYHRALSGADEREKDAETQESFSANVATFRDARSISQTCSVNISWRLGSEMLANIISFKELEHERLPWPSSQ